MAKAKWTRYDMRRVVDKATARALETIGLGLEGAAKRNIRANKTIKTGRLRASITHATTKTPARPGPEAKSGDGVSSPTDKYTVHVGTGVFYAPFIEYGTKRTPGGWPFLRPAMDENRKNMRDILSKELAQGFRSGK